MRKLALGLALCSTALSSPAFARDNTAYVELGFGPSLAQDFDFQDFSDGETIDVTLEEDYGFDGGVVLGYDYGAFRIEVEGNYREYDHDELSALASDISVQNPLGKSSAASIMGNALLDLGNDDGIQAFVGGGAGTVYVDQSIGLVGTGDDDNLINGDDWKFAWQALAGLRAPLTDSIDVGLRYRFFNIPEYRIGGSFATPTAETDWSSHSILGTVAFNFGRPAEPVVAPPPPTPAPPPPPPPATPPPPPAPVCQQGPYIVFFNWDKSDITPEAATILDNAVSAYANCGMASIMLAGHTDTSGSAQYNIGLAERRNASVRDYLTGRGIPGGRISSEAFGETQLRVPTADGVRELQNRRVEVTYGPGSGM